jgi:hypothetical protein
MSLSKNERHKKNFVQIRLLRQSARSVFPLWNADEIQLVTADAQLCVICHARLLNQYFYTLEKKRRETEYASRRF